MLDWSLQVILTTDEWLVAQNMPHIVQAHHETLMLDNSTK